MSDPRIAALVRFWETLTPEAVARLGEVYADDASFRDPFHDVRGLPALERIFARMFETLHEPRFTVRQVIAQGDDAVLVWDFDFRLRSWRPHVRRRIEGTSLVRFGADGRVAVHRDFWDAAGELYATLPLIGPLVRAVTRAISGTRRPSPRG